MYFDPIDCGNRVKKVRKAFGYTQEDVANKLNISASHYGKFECGKTLPSIDILIELAALLHLSLDFVLLGAEPHSDILKHKVHSIIEFLTAMEKEL
jgi:transcriptional regulator with XRE-family HTH domain